MIQSHPQWVRTMELVRAGRIGQLRSAIGSFSYFKLDAGNIRNIRSTAGAADGYRLLRHQDFADGFRRGAGARLGRDGPRSALRQRRHTDVRHSGLPLGHCIFTCSTQVALQQSMRFYGATGASSSRFRSTRLKMGRRASASTTAATLRARA